MLEFFIDNIYAQCAERVFFNKQSAMGTNCEPLLADIFIHSYGADLITDLMKAEDAFTTGAPEPCSQILVESELRIYICYFVCIILVIYVPCCVCLFSISGLSPWIIEF